MLRRNGLTKNTLQRDIIHYFKYREFSGIFTIIDHISDNSIQINIRFTSTVYEYIIVYEYILLSNFMYILYLLYIFIYICVCVFRYVYIYIYINCVFLFILTLSQHILTLVALVSHSHILFQLVLLDCRH